MKVIVLDDEQPALKRLVKSVREAVPEAEIHPFNSAEDALAFTGENPVDVAFLDIRGLDLDGVTLARKLKAVLPKLNIIFTTGYSDYALDAMELYASGYLLKPITAEKVKKALGELRYPVEQKKTGRLRLQCFGNFEAFYDGTPLDFHHARTKELLAYLYDRKGALCTTGELLAVLWEDDGDHTNYLKQLRKDLVDTFEALQLGDLLLRQRGGMSVRYDAIESDYRDWLSGTASGINAFRGEYMAQYSWAEVTAASLLDGAE